MARQHRTFGQAGVIRLGNEEEVWTGPLKWAGESMLTRRSLLANHEDMNIPVCVGTLEDAVKIIRKNRREGPLSQRSSKP